MRLDYSSYVADAVRFSREILHWNPDPKQVEVLEYTGDRAILNWGRQCGKSTVMAALAVHFAVTHPGTVVVMMGGSGSHTAQFASKVDSFLGEMGWKTTSVSGQRIARRL